VYAVATVNFLDHHLRDPSDQLDIITKSPESTAHEGETELKVYKCLDSLYMLILQESFRKNKVKDNDMVRSVLNAVVVVTNSPSPSAITTLTGLSRTSVPRLQSLLVLPEDLPSRSTVSQVISRFSHGPGSLYRSTVLHISRFSHQTPPTLPRTRGEVVEEEHMLDPKLCPQIRGG